MGIPRLTRHLLPFFETVILAGEQHGRCSPNAIPYVGSVVIDGPSLVYHVYFRLLSWMPLAPNVAASFDSQPTCQEVSVGVMTYLLQLATVGVEM